jgi:hypothetical protein
MRCADFACRHLTCCSRLSFAAKVMAKHLNIRPGAVSVLGPMNDTDKKFTLLPDGGHTQKRVLRLPPLREHIRPLYKDFQSYR